jgi:hypothetical protein
MTNLIHRGEQKTMTQIAYPEVGYESLPDIDEVDAETPVLPDLSDELEDGADEELDEAEDNGAGASAGPRAAAAKPNKALIRKIAAKALEVAAADDSTCLLTAALLGSGEDTVELTTAIMTAGRGAGQPLSDIAEIVTALKDEPWEAGVIATALDATRQKAVWNLLYARDAVGSPTQPKSQQKAGSAIVKAIHGLTEADKTGLTAAGDLLKRS